MSASSELGPIDPLITLQPGNSVPAQFILQAQQVDPIIYQFADYAVKQTTTLARSLLKGGMLSGKTDAEIDQAVSELSTRNVYYSHGSVIDHQEAMRLGLKVQYLPPDDGSWKWIWLLRCIYEVDARRAGAVNIFEGLRLSASIRPN